MDPDLTDVRRVIGGDPAAFENIVRRFQGPLINLAFRFCRDRQRSEDLAQEAFLQIYRQLPRFRGESAFSTWVFAVSLNIYRSALRRRQPPVDSIEGLTEIAGGRHPFLEVTRHEREDLVRRAVAALPERYRDAVIVFYFNEMNLAETARVLGVAEGTAKAWLHRGREMLRRKLGHSVDTAAQVEGVCL